MKKIKTITLKGALLISLGTFCIMQTYAQAPPSHAANQGKVAGAKSDLNLSSDMQEIISSLQSLSTSGTKNVSGVISSLQSLSTSVDSKTNTPHFQNLSSSGASGASSVEGASKASSVEGTQGASGASKFSSEEVASKLSESVSKLEGLKDNSLQKVIASLKSITEKYKGSSYQSIRSKIK